ncbi:hypothetical protein B1745_00135 [Lactobacillus amylolyticus]|uniref:ATP-binding protein n=1 Tax=Lactobacillus amylolyticus TaxID=83683 RepID=UPI0009BADFAB|nr:hypothetical protein [Lactobacillus amylolyticus]ARD06167.1 hypothetical protein B1745_00135 [Lactobacillus amylolyticus]
MSYQPDLNEISNLCRQAINMAIPQTGENSYNLSFTVEAKKDGLYMVYYSPSGIDLTQQLYNKLTSVISNTVYPYFTVYPQPAPLVVPMATDDIHQARAWLFPWSVGVPKRLQIKDLNEFIKNNSVGEDIWLMNRYKINVNKITSIALMGLSGSGKTMLAKYLNNYFAYYGTVITIDPKGSRDLVWWGRHHKQEVIYPAGNVSKSEFLTKVNDRLSDVLHIVYRRQNTYLESEDMAKKQFKPIFVTIDELGALTSGVNKQIKDAFFSLLTSLTLLGRETNVHSMLISQVLSNLVIPTQVRDQTSVRILLGQVNSKSAQYLFPDFDVSSIVVPRGIATGIIQTINNEEVPAVTPFLAPTILN